MRREPSKIKRERKWKRNCEGSTVRKITDISHIGIADEHLFEGTDYVDCEYWIHFIENSLFVVLKRNGTRILILGD